MRRNFARIAIARAALTLTVLPAVPAAGWGEIDCRCRFGGQKFEAGTCLCISTSEGSRVACCGKVLNNSAWKFTNRMCPMAGNVTAASTQVAAGMSEPAPPEGSPRLSRAGR